MRRLPSELFNGNKNPQIPDRHRDLSDDELIKGLREYIQKNKALPNFFKRVEQNRDDHQESLERLLYAINQADFDSPIFTHPYCAEYIIYLIENKQLDFSVGYDAYIYWMTLAQFTDKQKLKDGDQDVKSIRNVQVQPLVNHNELTEFGASYLVKLINQFKEYGIDIDLPDLHAALLEMHPFSRVIIQLDSTNEKDDSVLGVPKGLSDVSKGLYNTRANVLFCQDSDDLKFDLPSYQFRKFIYHQMNGRPLQEKPIFGSIGQEKLYDLHDKDQHPTPIYSLLVKLGLKDVHGYLRGPLPVFLHDISHIFGANLITLKERTFLQHELIPALKKLKEGRENTALGILIDRLNNEITDFFFAYVGFYKDKDSRVNHYLKRIFDMTTDICKDIQDNDKYNHLHARKLTPDDIKILIDGLQKFRDSIDYKKYGIKEAAIANFQRQLEQMLPQKGWFSRLNN